MAHNITIISLRCLRLILKPIARFCLNRSISIQDVTEAFKITMIDLAEEEILKSGEKPNVSRLSVMTGLHRRDVMRIIGGNQENQGPSGLISRIVAQWEQDQRFSTKAGMPRVLTCGGDKSEFSELVRCVSSDVHPGTIYFQLERLGMIEKVKGNVRLKKRAENLRGDPEKGYFLLGQDVSSLITATNENLFGALKTPNLHARTEYDNIFKEDIPKIRDWLLKEGTTFHQKARNFLSKYDKDFNPHLKREGGGKVVLTAFSHVEKGEL